MLVPDLRPHVVLPQTVVTWKHYCSKDLSTMERYNFSSLELGGPSELHEHKVYTSFMWKNPSPNVNLTEDCRDEMPACTPSLLTGHRLLISLMLLRLNDHVPP